MKMWSHLLSLIYAVGFAATVLIGTAEVARADCPDKLIGANDRSGKYQWQGQCLKITGCRPCGPVHTRNIKYKTKGYGKCSRNKIASKRADGCSAPSGKYKKLYLSTPYKKKFKAACDEHDVCYATYGKKKRDCDKAFDRNMADMCKRAGKGCKPMAYAFFNAVFLAGLPSYRNGQKYANENCKSG